MLRLSCDEFCNYLKHFQGTEDVLRSIETAIDQCITDNCIGNTLDDHIAILGDACLTDGKRTEYNLQHIAEWLFWFCYDNDFGREKLSITDKEEELVIASSEDLYHYLNRFF